MHFKPKAGQLVLYSICLFVTLLVSCGDSEPEPVNEFIPDSTLFLNDARVRIEGYNGSAMEPFITRDDQYLFFNNSSSDSPDMNLHFAKKITNTSFEYLGELPGTNTESLEGVPTMDENGNLYFTSLRSYTTSFKSLYGGIFDGTVLLDVGSIDQSLNPKINGIINFDSEVSANGQTLYYATGKFSENTFPDEANLQIATLVNDQFRRLDNSDDIMININSGLLEYAAAISEDELELFYTRALITEEETQIRIFNASRNSKSEPFDFPEVVGSIIGIQTEGPSISSDGKRLYYHKNENGGFGIYMVSRKKL